MRRFHDLVQRHQVVFVYIAFVAFAVSVVAIVRGEDTRDDVPGVAERATSLALDRNCKTDRRFRLAYKERAEVERKFLGQQRSANAALVDVVDELGRAEALLPSLASLRDKLTRVNTKLSAYRGTLVIYPVPRCGSPTQTERSKPHDGREGGDDARKTNPRSDGERGSGNGAAGSSGSSDGASPGGGADSGPAGGGGTPPAPPTDPPPPPAPGPSPSPGPGPSPTPTPTPPSLGDQVNGITGPLGVKPGGAVDNVTGIGCQVTGPLGVCIK